MVKSHWGRGPVAGHIIHEAQIATVEEVQTRGGSAS